MSTSLIHVDPAARNTLVRSGTAARLAGLSPSTLRIWEHRYAVVAPPKTATGQRTYSLKDVERLRLIKRLTVEGHTIGTLAHLDVAALAELSSGGASISKVTQRVVIVGQAAARKLEGRLRPAPTSVFDDLEHAERDFAHAGAVDVLVIHVSSLHDSMTERLVTLGRNLSAPNVIVVYAFGAEGVAEALRTAGITVRREPVSGREMARLIAASRPIVEATASASMSNIKRYSDAELVALTEIPSAVACECPRHLAEIVSLLSNFERYSAECEARDENDAALHRHLHEVTTAARAMFEAALQRVIAEEGLTL
jgi:DNA-binding transcriptional MerR regulator